MDKEEILQKVSSFQSELKNHAVRELYVFGSFARSEAGQASDLDLLVEFEPGVRVGLFAFARLQRQLCKLLGKKVDLVTKDAIRPEMREEILREAVRAA